MPAARTGARRRARGFTITELMIGLTLIGILLALGVPAFSSYLQNSKLAASARSFVNGVQTARAEAIRLNVPVEFILTDTTIANAVATGASSATGRTWVVRANDPASGPQQVDAKAAQEGTGGADAVQVTGDVASLTFNGLGATTLGARATFNFTSAIGVACAPAGPARCMRVVVSPNGRAVLCDPAAAVGDSRACP
jgi:type IV fimbrial biogenesis protein FimT